MTITVEERLRRAAQVLDEHLATALPQSQYVRGPATRGRRRLLVAALVAAAVVVGVVVARLPDRSKVATGPGSSVDPSTAVSVNHRLSDLNVRSVYPVGREWQRGQAWSSPVEYYRAAYDLFQEATRVCMAAKGFDYRVGTFANDDLLFERMNPLNEAAAQRFGYHLPDEPFVDPNANASASFLDAASSVHGCGNQAGAFAFNGPSGAKFSSQHDTLQQSAEAAIAGVSSIAGFFSTKVGQDLLRAWSECMSSKGYRYASPDDAQTAFEGRPQVTPTELAVRIADLNCDKTVGLTRSRSQYEQSTLNAWLSQHAANISELTDTIRAAQQEVSTRRLALSNRGVDALQHP